MKRKSKEPGITRKIARFIVETPSADIPSHLYEHAKTAFLDWSAVTIAGKDEPLVTKLMDYAHVMGGHEQATLIGHGHKTSAGQAALINGAASHALDFDDGMELFMGHPSATIFPSLLALSEWKGLSGPDFLTAYILGIEAGAAIGHCAGHDHYRAGWHGTATIGRLASSAACSRLLQLDEQRTVYALGIAGTLASGLRLSFGSMCKSFHAGKAAQAGLEAALLAGNQFISAENILEGQYGFFQTMNCSQMTDDACTGSLGKIWNLNRVLPKYHASDTCTHPVMEAALEIVEEAGLSWQEIKSVRVYSSPACADVAGKMNPMTGLEAKWSMTYCIANALLRGDTGPKAFTDERVNDPEITGFMKRISLDADTGLRSHEARVEIETQSNGVFQRLNDTPVLELDVKKNKVKNKVINLCTPLVGEEKIKALFDAVLTLEKYGDMKDFIELLHKT